MCKLCHKLRNAKWALDSPLHGQMKLDIGHPKLPMHDTPSSRKKNIL